ncbi:MAG: hypothetical protein ACTHKQ_17895 [Mesorhizobium sp.]
MNGADLVAQLRKAADEMRTEDQNGWPVTCDEAADRIEALEADIASLKATNIAFNIAAQAHSAWKAEAMEVFSRQENIADGTLSDHDKVREILRAARRLVEKEDGR